MRPFAIDANAIASFQQERITKSDGDAVGAIRAILTSDCIALDIEKLCYQEWINVAGGSVPFALTDWISDLLATGKVRFYNLSPNDCRKPLLKLGLPPDDHKWVRLAIGSGGKVLVTGDVDFFDPSKKSSSAKVKDKVRKSGKGPCCKALKRDFGIQIIDTSATVAYVNL